MAELMLNKENLFMKDAYQGYYTKVLPREPGKPSRVVLGISGSNPMEDGDGLFHMTCRFSNPSRLRDLIDSLSLKLLWLESEQEKMRREAME